MSLPYRPRLCDQAPNSRRRRRTVALLSGLLAIGAGTLAAFIVPRGASGPDWRGWSLVYVPSDVPESMVLEFADRTGIHDILSPSRQPVVLAGWPSPTETTLGELDKRLIPGDPRRDSYIRGLDAWFRTISPDGRSFAIYYVPDSSGKPAAALIRELMRSGVDAGTPTSPGAPGRFDPLMAMLALITLLALTLLQKRPDRLPALAALLPMGIAASGGGAGAAAAMIAAAAISLAIPIIVLDIEEARRCGRIQGFLFRIGMTLKTTWMVLLSLLACLVSFPGLPASIGLALMGSCAGIAAYITFPSSRRRFTPVPISVSFVRPPSRRLGRTASIGAITGGIVSLAFRLALLGGDNSAGSAELPLPRPLLIAEEARPDPDQAKVLMTGKESGQLVDLADWLAHRAWQESFIFMPLGSMPSSAFSIPDLPSAKEGSGLPRFDREWSRKIYRSIPAVSIEAILDAMPGFARAIVSMSRLTPSPRTPLAPREIILYIILLAPLLYRALPSRNSMRRAAALERTQPS